MVFPDTNEQFVQCLILPFYFTCCLPKDPSYGIACVCEAALATFLVFFPVLRSTSEIAVCLAW